MALQEGTIRTSKMTAVITALGATAQLKIFSGTLGGNCAAGDPTGLLATIPLPNPPFTAAAGALTLSGSWTVSASGSGTATCFRIYDSSAGCQMQGNVTTDLVLNNTSITAGQTVTVTTFGVTAGNA